MTSLQKKKLINCLQQIKGENNNENTTKRKKNENNN